VGIAAPYRLSPVTWSVHPHARGDNGSFRESQDMEVPAGAKILQVPSNFVPGADASKRDTSATRFPERAKPLAKRAFHGSRGHADVGLVAGAGHGDDAEPLHLAGYGPHEAD